MAQHVEQNTTQLPESSLDAELRSRSARGLATGDLLLWAKNRWLPARFRKDAIDDERTMNRVLSTLSLPGRFTEDGTITADKQNNEDRLIHQIQTVLGFQGKNVDGKVGALTRAKLHEFDRHLQKLASRERDTPLTPAQVADLTKERVSVLLNEMEQRFSSQIEALRIENGELRRLIEKQPTPSPEPITSIETSAPRFGSPKLSSLSMTAAMATLPSTSQGFVDGNVRSSPTSRISQAIQNEIFPDEPGGSARTMPNGESVASFRDGRYRVGIVRNAEVDRAIYGGIHLRNDKALFAGASLAASASTEFDAGGVALGDSSDFAVQPAGRVRNELRATTANGFQARAFGQATLLPGRSDLAALRLAPVPTGLIGASISREVGFGAPLGFEIARTEEKSTRHEDTRWKITGKSFTTLFRKPAASTDLMLETEAGFYSMRDSRFSSEEQGLGIATRLNGRVKRIRYAFSTLFGSSFRGKEQSAQVDLDYEHRRSFSLFGRFTLRDGMAKDIFSSSQSDGLPPRAPRTETGIKFRW